MKTDNGGPAYPSHGSMGEVAYEGMSLRDWYAGLTMQAFTGNMVMNDKITPAKLQASKLIDALNDIAPLAFAMADAMLKARKI